MNLNVRVLCGFVALSMASLSGCSSQEDLGPLATISGTVTIDGKPVKAGTNVVFMDPEKGTTALAATDSEGRFALKSFAKSGDSNEFPVGQFQASIQPPDEDYLSEDEITAEQALEGVSPGLQGKREYAARYESFATSGLVFNITEGENDINIDLSAAE